ncbi:MAG TPA: SPOR domain-containing protein [Burkholderiales bacterium]|jgi:hypothetical protein|nr:SPOR domain-containing protein [Burkholderiales bacterium]
MRWLVAGLALLNVGLAGYLFLGYVRVDPDAQVIHRQVNAEEIRIMSQPPAPPPARTLLACLEWRGFVSADLPRARDALARLALGPRLSEREVGAVARWWVHMPPQGSQAAMERKAGELRNLGVTDFYPVTESGQWRYAISLGLFRSEDAARTYLAQLRAKGVRSAQLTQRDQRIDQAAFVIRDPTAEESARLLELSALFPGTELRAVNCPA